MFETIVNSFDVWGTAKTQKSLGKKAGIENISLHGINRLRELIVNLATSGKLIKMNSKSFQKLVRVEDVAELVMGQAPPGKDCNKEGIGTVFVKTGEFGELYPEVKEWTTNPLKLAIKGDVLICVVGATVGKLNLAIDCAIGRSVAAIRPNYQIIIKYLYYSLMPYTLKLRRDSRGSAQGVIGKQELNAIEILLMPLEEQSDVVEKIEELMALCDKLEQQQINHIETHLQLVEALLKTLTVTTNANELKAAWLLLEPHFDILFTTEESVDLLQQTILQLAVMGKLVPQDPNDEPASVLLQKIAKEKQRLVKEGKLKKQNPLPEITEGEKPFKLPEGWEWSRWDLIALKIGDIDHRMPEEVKNGYPYISPRDFLSNNKIDYKSAKKISKEDFERLVQKIQPQKGDIIYPRYGTIGENRLVETDIDFLASYSCCVIKTMTGFIDSRYQFIFSISAFAKNQAKLAENKTTQANVGIKSIQEYIIPIPPLSEQKRIVYKVDKLMSLCNQLKKRIIATQELKVKLADAVMERAIN